MEHPQHLVEHRGEHLERAPRGRGNHEHQLWAVLMFQSWWSRNRKYIETYGIESELEQMEFFASARRGRPKVEDDIGRCEEKLPALTTFILPGGALWWRGSR